MKQLYSNKDVKKTEKKSTDPPESRQQKQEELQSCRLWNKNHIHTKIDKMKRQRAMYQMKEQDKTTEKQLNEVEIGNLPEKEFRERSKQTKQTKTKNLTEDSELNGNSKSFFVSN